MIQTCRSKYGNTHVTIDGITFDSALEAQRYCELLLLQKGRRISNLRRQVPFVLIPAFVKRGKKYRAINYVADFVYFDNDKKITVVEDAKGFRTPEYKLKQKLFEYVYPDLELKEITETRY